MRLEEFDLVWDNYIKPLKGKTIFTATGKKNIITTVSNDFLERNSSNDKISRIPKHIFKGIYYRLKEKKVLTRKEINKEFPIRASSIITAILGKVDTITLTQNPEITLKMK